MEEDVYDNEYDEIEALGGDPFFLEGDNNLETIPISTSSSTTEKGDADVDDNDAGFFWDGEVDDNAHMDLDLD